MGFLPLWLQYWSQLQLVSSAASFFPLSETDKVDTFSFSKNTVEIAPLDCGTHRYQTATGTGSSIHNTDKTVDIHTHKHTHFSYLSLPCPAYLYIPALLGFFCIVFLFNLPSRHPLILWLSLHFVTVSSLIAWILLLTPALEFESERNKHSHIHTQSHMVLECTHKKCTHTRERQVILRLSTVHLVTLI